MTITQARAAVASADSTRIRHAIPDVTTSTPEGHASRACLSAIVELLTTLARLELSHEHTQILIQQIHSMVDAVARLQPTRVAKAPRG